MKLMTYNILYGGEDRFEQILRVIGAEQPDLLVMQECLGWEDGQRLAAVAKVLGVPQAQTFLCHSNPRGSGKRYHLAVASRRPVAEFCVHGVPRPLAHSAVEIRLQSGLTCWGLHLVASDEDLRVAEIEYLLPLMGATRPAAILGDLNALSRRDPYPDNLGELFRQGGLTKYGNPPRFDVFERIEAAGWQDALYFQGPPRTWITAPRDRGGVHIDYRTDFILISEPLEVTEAYVVPAYAASDHAPVVVCLEEPPEGWKT